MKQIRIILLLILTLAIALTSLTSCDVLEQIGITLPGGNSDETPDETPDDTEEKPDPSTCGHYVTKTVNKVAATCTTEGYTGDKTCIVCDTVVTPGKATEKLPHNYADGVCTVCGEAQPGAVIPEEWKQYTTITIAEALAMCDDYVDAPSTERFYIIATVKSVDNASFGQLMIEDETGEIMVYGTNSADGSLKYDQMGGNLKKGDIVLLYGTLQNYNGNTKEVQNAWLIDYVEGISTPVAPTITPDTEITIAEAIANAGLVNANDRFYITATVKTVTKPQYGAMILVDAEGNEISVYNSANADGSVGYELMEDKPVKGDTVTVYATLHLFNDAAEIASAYITSFTHVVIDTTAYTEMNIQAAREAAKGTLIMTEGVVAAITYANGMVPAGFYLVDGTNSIYVYDRDAAGVVSVGNTVKVIGEKDYWILDTEIGNANKFGYEGCNQLSAAYVIENDNGNTDFDKSWITESTVKEIMQTPVSTDITTTIFKVTALVKKVPGNGFVNYYIDDLDGATGSYVYTQCNGSDFAWLDQFDGKICTVYLSAINAKSSAAGCIWRFLPVAVMDEGYVFDTTKAPEYAIEYHGIGQFVDKYTADPSLELLTSISSELLGFEGVTLTYTSSNSGVVTFTTEDGKTVMHLVEYGTATVTITATYGEYTCTRDVTITYEEAEEFEFITVDDAIVAEEDSTVTVKGIVGPSLINQVGFYLMGENGFIAVKTDSATMATLQIGNEIILTGKRETYTKGGTNYFGQSTIVDAVVLVNNLGSHEFNMDYFATDKTLDDLYNLDPTVDYTTGAYIVENVTLSFSKTAYSANLKLTSADGEFNLYSGNAETQYGWLSEYFGEEVTVVVAPCNWNDKNYYRGCVLAIILEDGTYIYNTSNFS